MNTAYRKNGISSSFIHALYLIFFTSLIFSLRAVGSISIVAIFLAEILIDRSGLNSLFKKNIQTLFLAGCFLFFLLQPVSLLYTNDTHEDWNNIRIKTGILITPLAIGVSSYITATTRKKLLSHYCLVLAIAALSCVVFSLVRYLQFHHSSVFFYHSLVKPLNQHAVYCSLLVMVGLTFLFENILEDNFLFSRAFDIIVAVFLSIFLFMLASKLVLLFFLVYMLSWFARLLKSSRVNKFVTAIFFTISILAVTLVFAVRNPISTRFYEIIGSNIKLVKQDSFKKSDYFNGLQFRLLQWRFVAEILTEKKRWLIGVSPGDAQSVLNDKYVSTNMYTGEPARGDRGYMAYNTHNQFLQTVLENGIIGLVVLLMICFSLLKMVQQNRNWYSGFLILLLLAWLFSEAALETQFGIMIFTFFPLFVQTDSRKSINVAK